MNEIRTIPDILIDKSKFVLYFPNEQDYTSDFLGLPRLLFGAGSGLSNSPSS